VNYTIINGCKDKNPIELAVIKNISEYLSEKKLEVTSNWVDLSEKKLHYCTGCDSCQFVNPGVCVINDGQNEILKKYLHSDKVFIITPIQFGCCSVSIKNFIDRMQPLFLSYQVLKNGRTVMKGRYDKYPELIFIGIKGEQNNDCIMEFQEFIQNLNSAETSNKVRIKIITEESDIHALKELIL
jgi:multimeric flavodoxin WrbA